MQMRWSERKEQHVFEGNTQLAFMKAFAQQARCSEVPNDSTQRAFEKLLTYNTVICGRAVITTWRIHFVAAEWR